MYICIGFYDKKEVMEIMTESMKMKEFEHPHVLGLIGVCIDAGPAPYIVMPFMANGSLLSYLRKERPNLLLDETADEDLVRVLVILLFSFASNSHCLSLIHITSPTVHELSSLFFLLGQDCLVCNHFTMY